MFVLLLVMFGSESIFGLHGIEFLAKTPSDFEDGKRSETLVMELYHKYVEEVDARTVSTFVFNTFVLMQVFNLINARVAGQDMSVVDGIFQNPYFIAIFFIIIVMHIVLSYFASTAFQTLPIGAEFWGMSVAFGAGELIIGFILRLIRLQDHTAAKLNALRELRRDEIKKFYQGVPGPQQWEMSSLDASGEAAKPPE
jgi:Ca2+-transporting ATPase